jgi:N-acetylmuramoyl-L-alanine amidase
MLFKSMPIRFLTFHLVLLLYNGFFFNPLYGHSLSNKTFVVVLDAGHGGHDPGCDPNCNNYGFFEKKIALNITLKIGKLLEKHNNIKVIYTRKSDVYVGLKERAGIANKADADLFISIHCDSFTSSKAFGAGTFVLGLHANQRNFEIAKRENSVIFYEEDYEKKYDGFDPNNPESVISLTLMQETYSNQSIEAAATIQKSFVSNLGRKDRTVKQAGFVVLKYTYMPSVLVETGFLTNKREGAYLNSKKGQNEMANAIAKAILNYKNELDKGVVNQQPFDVKQAPKKITKVTPNKTNDIRFRVQLAASKNPIDAKPYNFKGLKNVIRYKEGAFYKYYFGNSNNYKQIQKEQRKARRAGFKSAFIVSFRGNQKIKLSEALDALK